MRILFFCTFLCLLWACAPLQKKEMAFGERASFAFRERVADNTWTATGKIGVRYESQGFSSGFFWRQTGSNSELFFKMPLGHSFRIINKEKSCVYEDSKGEVFKSDSLKSLMTKEIGWYFPLDKAVFWIKGVPFPDEQIEKIEVGNGGELKKFRQGEWTITVERYFSENQMPRTISFLSQKISLKIALKQWEI